MQKHIYYFIGLVIFLSCDSEEVTTSQATKIDYYLESYDIPDLGFQPQYKVVYEYNSTGKLVKYRVLTYSPTSKSFEEQRHFDFIYTNNLVTQIHGSEPGDSDPYLEYAYEYLPTGRVSKITETNSTTGINSVANFVYDDSDRKTKVYYTFSNGGSFEYEFYLSAGNVVTDKTTRGSQLCSNGQYAYDNHINPFASFGYTEYLLTNLSANNKLSEEIDHINCSFPSFIPESYSYQYNEPGYPTLITTHYKTGSTIATSRREIFYK
jgi:hypothetical protein